MLRPTLDEVKAMAAKAEGNLVPIFREVTADLETPVSAFLKVRTGQYSFLLESVEGGERLARYSFIGTQPYRVLKTGPGQEYDGDHYVINGAKTWITNGMYGSAFAVLTVTDPTASPRHKGMSLFICEKGNGFSHSKHEINAYPGA